LHRRGFRLIGDSDDQPSYDRERVRSIIASCRGFVGVIPDRGAGRTSKYFIEEAEMARAARLPYLLACVGSPAVPPALVEGAVSQRVHEATEVSDAECDELADEARDTRPPEEHYVFFATSYRSQDEPRWKAARRLIERVTALPCKVGWEFSDADAIVESIRHASVVIADITYGAGGDRGPNSLIEAGIALGAERPVHYINGSPRRESPFMFRTRQQERYANDAGLLAAIHKLVRPYRRRVLNHELTLHE
jgi:hypothetical protein